jgi:hypothetical protein
MNGMRKLVGLLLAVILTAFALPAAAQSKQYSLNVSPSAITAGTTAPLSALFTNLTPNGNSSINSFKLTAPAGITIISATLQGTNGTLTIAPGGGSISVTGMFPVKPGLSFTVSLTVTTNPSCTSSAGNWVAVVYEGSNLSGQTFAFVSGSSSVSTNVNSVGCTYSVTASSGSVPAGAATQLTMTLKNTATSTVPAINSLSLTAPAGLTVTAVGGSGGGVSVSYSGNTVSVTGLSLAFGQTFAFTVTVSTAPSCTGSGAVAWTSSVTPSGFSGTNPSTSITGGVCSLTISLPPGSVGAGSPFQVTVSLSGGPGSANVTLAVAAGCTGTGGGTTGTTGGSASFNVTIAQTVPPSTQSCTLNVSADNGYPPNSVTISNVFGGVLGCDSSNDYDSILGKNDSTFDPRQDIAFIGNPGWGLLRGANTDGLKCIPVPYTFNFDPDSKTASFTADKSGISPPQAMSVEYLLLWKPVNPDGNGWASGQPMVAWLNMDGSPANQPGTLAYIPAQTCSSDDMTQPGAIMPVMPPVLPFTNAPYYADGTKKAQMCIAQQGWTAIGGGLIQYWDKVIDQSDGHVTGP